MIKTVKYCRISNELMLLNEQEEVEAYLKYGLRQILHLI